MAQQNFEVGKFPPHPFVEEIDHREINKISMVGKGSFGTVYKAMWKDQYVAVKYIEQESERNAFTIEVRQLSRVSHPNIVGLYGACTQKPNVCLVMEFAEGGSLYNVLHCSPRIQYTAGHAMSWAKQCAEGVAYLHAMTPRPLIHRDLKPPNLLLIKGGTVLKICDFGTVTDKNTLMTNNKGSAAWMAPEVFEGSNYTEKCDVFSWGIILWEVISRQQPFKEVEYTYRIMWSVHMGRRPPLIEGCPKPIEKLMTTCWDQVPANRPAMGEVVNQMLELCKFFPGGDLPLVIPLPEEEEEEEEEEEYDEYDTTPIDTNASGYTDSYNQTSVLSVNTNSSSAVNTPNQVANIISALNRQHLQNANKQQAHLNHIKNRSQESGRAKDARWGSTEEDNSEPRIVSGRSISNNNSSDTLSSRIGTIELDIANANRSPLWRNGLKNEEFMKPLELEVDKHAWDLKSADHEELQRLGVNTSNSQGRENLTVTETRNVQQQQPSATHLDQTDNLDQNHHHHHHLVDDNSDAGSLDLDSMHLMLEPHLRPGTPDPNNRLSQQIFEENKKIAQEYLKVQTEIAYSTRHRDEILASMEPEQREERLDICRKLEEMKNLQKLEANLKVQLDLIKNRAYNSAQHQQQQQNQQQVNHQMSSPQLQQQQSPNNNSQHQVMTRSPQSDTDRWLISQNSQQ